MVGRVHIYALGQALGYAIDLSLFFTCMNVFGLSNAVAANVFSKICSAIFAYFFHEKFSFPGRKKNAVAKSSFMFAVVVAGNMVLTSFLILLLHSMMGLQSAVSKIAADIIGVIATYLGMRLLVFARVGTQR